MSPSSLMISLQTLQCLAFLNVFTRKVWEWRASSSSGCSSERAIKTKEMKCYNCVFNDSRWLLKHRFGHESFSAKQSFSVYLLWWQSYKPKVLKSTTSAFPHPGYPHLSLRYRKEVTWISNIAHGCIYRFIMIGGKYRLKSWHKTSKRKTVCFPHFPFAGVLCNSNVPSPQLNIICRLLFCTTAPELLSLQPCTF